MIDTHCHLEMGEFDDEREDVLRECENRLEAIIDSSAEIETTEQVLKLSEENDFVFSTLGLHPEPVLSKNEEEIERHLDFIRNNSSKIVGIGEVGLDYYLIRGRGDREITKNVFKKYIELAEELSLPLVIHARDSINDTLDILANSDLKKVIMHCFSGNIEQLKEALDRDYMISLSTLVCNSSQHKKLASRTPLDNILLETDSPYLSPDTERNYPWKIEKAARKIAQIKGLNFKEVWRKGKENAVKTFDLSIE